MSRRVSRNEEVVRAQPLDETSKTAPYDHLRRARGGELRHQDGSGLTDLFEDYFANADDLELVGPPTSRAA